MNIPLCKKLVIDEESAKHIIGKQKRNIYLVNKLLKPGYVTVTFKKNIIIDNLIDYEQNYAELELYGPKKDHEWCKKAFRIVRSARRGGIIKWFDTWNRQRFNVNTDQKWLQNIRRWEKRTDCAVEQHAVPYGDETYEVWFVLQKKKASDLGKAINEIGRCVHKRFKKGRTR